MFSCGSMYRSSRKTEEMKLHRKVSEKYSIISCIILVFALLTGLCPTEFLARAAYTEATATGEMVTQ